MQKTENTEAFGLIIQRKREAMGWNQSELAKLSGVSRSYISQLEAVRKLKDGETPQSPSKEISDALADALGESRDFFRKLNGHPTTDDESIDNPIYAELTSGLSRYSLLEDTDRDFVLRQARTSIEFLLERGGEGSGSGQKLQHKDPKSLPGVKLEDAKRTTKKK